MYIYNIYIYTYIHCLAGYESSTRMIFWTVLMPRLKLHLKWHLDSSGGRGMAHATGRVGYSMQHGWNRMEVPFPNMFQFLHSFRVEILSICVVSSRVDACFAKTNLSGAAWETPILQGSIMGRHLSLFGRSRWFFPFSFGIFNDWHIQSSWYSKLAAHLYWLVVWNHGIFMTFPSYLEEPSQLTN